LVILWLVAPIVAVFVISQFRPMFFPRFFLIVVPACSLLVAVGLVRLASSRPVLWIIPAALMLVLVWAGFHPPANLRKPDWRSAMAYVSGHAQTGDLVFVYPEFEGMTASHYATPEMRAYRSVRALPPGTIDSEEAARSFVARAREETAGAWLVVGRYALRSDPVAAFLLKSGTGGAWSFERGGKAIWVIRLSGDPRGQAPSAR
jgi:hypothetical protein